MLGGQCDRNNKERTATQELETLGAVGVSAERLREPAAVTPCDVTEAIAVKGFESFPLHHVVRITVAQTRLLILRYISNLD